MQIIPTSTGSSLADFWNSDTAGQSDTPFAAYLESVHEAIDSVREGNSVSVSTALREDAPAQTGPLVQGPYSRNSTDGVTYTLDEVCFTKKELLELRRELIKAGAPEVSLKKFDTLADQPDGATLAQVMASLLGSGAAIPLTDGDKANIKVLLGKIDPSGVLETRLRQLMDEGRGEEALDSLSAFLAEMDPADSFEVNWSEVVSLGKGLGLDQNSLQLLANSFGQDALRCNGGQFSALLAPAASQFTEDKANRQKLEAALEQTLKPLISKARDRSEKEKAASALRSREAQQSKVLIDRTVQENSRAVLDQTLRAGQDAPEQTPMQSTAVSKDLDGSQSASVGHAGAEKRTGGDNTAKHASDAAQARSASHADNAADNQTQTVRQANEARLQNQNALRDADNGERHTPSDGERDQSRSKDNSWSELLQKVDVKAAPAQGRGGDSIVYSMLQGQGAALANETTPTAEARPLARQVAQQVEQGLLSTSKNGATRLDLQLHPQELGSITITLTARNGEVSAIIRSEKTETAEMVSRQMDAIRINLEQQGLKVDKIEVQLENRQQDEGLWQNMDQHNSWQEEDARREELARLKNLASLRNSNGNSNLSTLEQPVHSLTQTARSATRSLHVVA